MPSHVSVPLVTRRQALRGLGFAAGIVALPRPVVAAPFRVSWVTPSGITDGSPFLDELRSGLRELGWIEGRNLVLEPHWGEDSPQRVEKLVADIVASKPNVIVAQGSTAPAVRRTNTTIPVVFGFSGDPVEAKLVDSYARPGRNLTGVSYLALALVGKRVELLKEVMPGLKRLAVVAHPLHPGDQSERHVCETAATALGLTTQYFDVRGSAQILDALAAIERSRSEAVVMFPVQSVIVNRERIAAWAVKHRLPTVSGWAQFAEGGNLMSYGPNLRDSSRRLAVFVDKILKGAKPADIPVEIPTRVELVVNLKAARALGITVPQTIQLRADRIID